MAKADSTLALGGASAPAYKSTAPRTYRPGNKGDDMSIELPFVLFDNKGGEQHVDHWHVPPDGCDDSFEETLIGRRYAAHYAQFLKDNPDSVGYSVLLSIVQDMLQKQGPKVKHTSRYVVGFLAHVDELVYMAAKRIEVFEHAAMRESRDRVVNFELDILEFGEKGVAA